MTSVRTVSLAIAALLLLAAKDTAAQNQRPIRQRDVAAAQVQDVYALVEKLRPEWLWVGGDPQFAASRAKVRVWVGDTQVGGLEALRGLAVENLYSVRLVGRQVARGRHPRLDPEVVGALLVRYEDGKESRRRFEVTAGIGQRGLLEARARQSMVDAGLDTLSGALYWRYGISRPPTVFLAGAMHLHDHAGVSASVLHTGGHNVRGIPPRPPYEGISNRFSTTDLAAEVFAAPRYLRLGAGPALRVLQYQQSLGSCECREPEGGSRLVLGGAADVGVIVPPTALLHLQLAFAARWFPSHSVPASRGLPELEMGGFTTYLTISGGFGF